MHVIAVVAFEAFAKRADRKSAHHMHARLQGIRYFEHHHLIVIILKILQSVDDSLI